MSLIDFDYFMKNILHAHTPDEEEILIYQESGHAVRSAFLLEDVTANFKLFDISDFINMEPEEYVYCMAKHMSVYNHIIVIVYETTKGSLMQISNGMSSNLLYIFEACTDAE